MRRKLPYLVMLAGALMALIGSAAWAASRDGRSARLAIGPASSCAPTGLGDARVDVRAMGMERGGGTMGASRMGGRPGMMRLVTSRAAVPGGRVSFVVQNVGGAVHELVVLPLAAGQSAGQRAIGADDRVSEAGSLGEASQSCGAGVGDGIAPGTIGWVTLQLAPGRYELVCNLRGHYAAGMYAELDVE